MGTSPLALITDDQLVALMEEHGTLVALGTHLRVSDNKVHQHIRRVELARPEANLKARLAAARRLSDAKVGDSARIDWPEDSVLAETVRNAPSIDAAAKSLGVSESTLRARCKSRRLDVKGLRAVEKLTVKGSRVTIEASELRSAAEMCKRRGIKISDYRIERIKVNEWGRDPATDQPYAQLTATLVEKPNLEWIFPAVVPNPVRPKPKKRKRSQTAPETWVIVGDHQAPLFHEGAHKAFVRFCERVKPTHGVHLGDLIDLGSVSRFTDSGDERFNAPVQTCINSGFQILSDIVQASPCTEWSYLLGNHDERIRSELLTRAERLFGIRPADIPGAGREDDALSLRRLLRLDDLHITLVDSPAGWKHNVLNIGTLEVRHGMYTGGNPSMKLLETIQTDGVGGHVHSKATSYRTLFDADGVSTVIQAADIGCMCQNNLGYNIGRSQWMLGWAVVTHFPNGLTNIEHVVYHEKEGVAVWRQEQY